MEPMVVEVRYQGIVVGRAARARDATVDGAFLETDAPMPVGAIVTITPEGGPSLRARVARVTEVGEARGMALSWTGLDETGRAWLTTGLGAPPVDRAGPSAPAVPAGADDAATQRTEVPPAGAVAEEVAPADEISAPIDVPGAPAEGEGGGKKRRRKRK
jgi:hypothetical protein